MIMVFSPKNLRRYGKPVLFLALFLPALWLVWNWWQAFSGAPHALGFNPQETSNRFTGDWALRFLLMSMAVTPLITLTGMKSLMLFRRMIGLFAFFYVCLHIVSYVWLDMQFDWPELWMDILKRLYITVGMMGFLCLVPLAITSTNGWIRRLGARQWQRLHRLVYIIGILAIIHFIMMRKGFQYEPLIYGGILMVLLLVRLPSMAKKRNIRIP